MGKNPGTLDWENPGCARICGRYRALRSHEPPRNTRNTRKRATRFMPSTCSACSAVRFLRLTNAPIEANRQTRPKDQNHRQLFQLSAFCLLLFRLAGKEFATAANEGTDGPGSSRFDTTVAGEKPQVARPPHPAHRLHRSITPIHADHLPASFFIKQRAGPLCFVSTPPQAHECDGPPPLSSGPRSVVSLRDRRTLAEQADRLSHAGVARRRTATRSVNRRDGDLTSAAGCGSFPT